MQSVIFISEYFVIKVLVFLAEHCKSTSKTMKFLCKILLFISNIHKIATGRMDEKVTFKLIAYILASEHNTCLRGSKRFFQMIFLVAYKTLKFFVCVH
jgi:hypothetical protein